VCVCVCVCVRACVRARARDQASTRYIKCTCYLLGCWTHIPSQKEVFFFFQGNRVKSTKMLCVAQFCNSTQILMLKQLMIKNGPSWKDKWSLVRTVYVCSG
jgi:hypothetical protein